MKWTDMLTATPEALRAHYRAVRELAYNNGKMAQGCSRGATLSKLARQQGYLQTQISMCENVARKRKIALVEQMALSV